MNEYENYIEDGLIVDQQTVRLPEAEAGRSPAMHMMLRVRKIKSNIENILQLLWEREAARQKAKKVHNQIFTGDRDIDELESEDEARDVEVDLVDPSRHKSEAQLQNEARRKELLEAAPKIERLQSKVCKFLSDHEDVTEFDSEEYPPGTEKISSFMALDVQQELREKEHTIYKSYVQVLVCSGVGGRHMWDDSVNVRWETF